MIEGVNVYKNVLFKGIIDNIIYLDMIKNVELEEMIDKV